MCAHNAKYVSFCAILPMLATLLKSMSLSERYTQKVTLIARPTDLAIDLKKQFQHMRYKRRADNFAHCRRFS
ncbi:hypothetical protein LU632_09530 [Erwinia tracheiphila]|uniref:hypothetical protein n=2 Tax=Erwinia tracheiphila TaxID=65700 RepID=UPI001F3074AD|nr:hypothetical protein [Erwinia tracheiphila]UIA93675.1 hypothetical protein LU632_09530 [Erwinia tracheiphila]